MTLYWIVSQFVFLILLTVNCALFVAGWYFSVRLFLSLFRRHLLSSLHHDHRRLLALVATLSVCFELLHLLLRECTQRSVVLREGYLGGCGSDGESMATGVFRSISRLWSFQQTNCEQYAEYVSFAFLWRLNPFYVCLSGVTELANLLFRGFGRSVSSAITHLLVDLPVFYQIPVLLFTCFCVLLGIVLWFGYDISLCYNAFRLSRSAALEDMNKRISDSSKICFGNGKPLENGSTDRRSKEAVARYNNMTGDRNAVDDRKNLKDNSTKFAGQCTTRYKDVNCCRGAMQHKPIITGMNSVVRNVQQSHLKLR